MLHVKSNIILSITVDYHGNLSIVLFVK